MIACFSPARPAPSATSRPPMADGRARRRASDRGAQGDQMTNYQASDLRVLTDGMAVIRKLFGPKMLSEGIASQLARDLIFMDSLPLHVRRVDAWWVVSSAKDWLVQSDGSVSLRNFQQIMPFPAAGREACHSEILLTAFADAVVTRGANDEMTWIAGDQHEYGLPADALELMRRTTGRAERFF
jgi:hypothetical protein